MKASNVALLLAVVLAPAHGDQTNPISKVLQMLNALQGKLIAEGELAHKTYVEFSNWCESRSQELHFEIKTGKSQVASLKAGIEKATADGEALEAKISDTASDLSDDESELKEATGIREGERKAFLELEKELETSVDTLERAMSIVEKEMKGGAFLQMQRQANAQDVVQALQAMVDASSVSQSDASRLTALIQGKTSEEDEDESDEVGAPSASTYKSSSSPILETLQGLLEKTESQLAKARKQEEQSQHEYNMKKQSLEDSKTVAKTEMDEAKSSKAATEEKKASSEGDLTSTSKDLKEDIKEMEELHHTCLSKATAFEEETKARGEEIETLAKAKKIISETTGDAEENTYSFVQVDETLDMSAGNAALRTIRRLSYSLARTSQYAGLAQLASRMQSALRLGNVDGADPFAKVKGMLQETLKKLEQDAAEDAGAKDFCDKELADTTAKLDDKKDEVEKQSTKLAQMQGTSKKLKSQVATLQQELAALAKAQAELDKIRAKEKAAYEESRPEMESGLNGVKKALKVLKEYYAKPSFVQTEDSGRDPNSIIGLLEVAESDFSKLLAEIIADEENAVATYEEATKENDVAKVTKDEDVKYKTKEAAGLDKAITDLKSDLDGSNDELSAIEEYEKQVKAKCTTMPATYEERKKEREEEIAGLRQSLKDIEGLKGEAKPASFIQEASSARTERNVHLHA